METVEYRELYSNDFDNFTVGLVLHVSKDENYNTRYESAKKWVQAKLKNEHEEYISLEKRIRNQRLELIRLEKIARKKMLEIRFQNMTQKKLDEYFNSEIPF